MNLKEKWNNLVRRVNKNRSVRKLKIFLGKLVLPGFEGVPFLAVMRFFFESLFKGILFQRAEAITYRIFISIIPMFMALFAAISFLDESIRIQLLEFIESIVPDYTWPAISNMISEVIMNQNNALLWSSFGIGIFLVLLSMNSIVTSLNVTYFKMQTRNLFQQLLVCLGLIVVFGIIIVLVAGIFVGTSWVIHQLNGAILGPNDLYIYSIKALKWILLFVMVYFFISALFYFAPANKKTFRFFSAGSTLSTVSMVILLYALNFYFYYFPTYNVIYGSIGALFAILLWLYWNSVIILIGFDLNVSIYVAKHKRKKGNRHLDQTSSNEEPTIVVLKSVITREELETDLKLEDLEEDEQE